MQAYTVHSGWDAAVQGLTKALRIPTGDLNQIQIKAHNALYKIHREMGLRTGHFHLSDGLASLNARTGFSYSPY